MSEAVTQDGSSCFPFIKDPDAVLDYLFNWTSFLGGDTISSYTVVASGLTIDSSSNTTTDVTVWLSGGTVYQKATVTCHIVTAGGREEDRTMHFTIKQK